MTWDSQNPDVDEWMDIRTYEWTDRLKIGRITGLLISGFLFSGVFFSFSVTRRLRECLVL